MTERDLPPMNALRAFESVARTGSVTGAAAELHVTHGAVSRQLRLLDEAAGQPLFVKQGRGLMLTDPGKQLHVATAAAFEQLRESWSILRQHQTSAPFVLGCSSSLLARWLIPRLELLGRELPELRLHLVAQENEPAPELGQLDAELLLATAPWPSRWQVEVLADEQTGPVVSPGYAGWPRLQGQPAEVLRDEPLLHTHSRPQAWPDWMHSMGFAPEPLLGAGFPHLYHLLEAAIAGLGVAIAPAPLVAEDLASGRLIAPWGFRKTGGAWILATPHRTTDPRAAQLAEWLRRELVGHHQR